MVAELGITPPYVRVLSSLPCPNRDLVVVFAVQVDERDELPALIEANRARLRNGGHIPAGGQQDRVPESMQGPLEDELVDWSAS